MKSSAFQGSCWQISNPDPSLKPRISSLRTSRLSHGSKRKYDFLLIFQLLTHQLTTLELQSCTGIHWKINRNFRQTDWRTKNFIRCLCFCKHSSHILFRLIIVGNGRWWIHAYVNYGKISHLKRIFEFFNIFFPLERKKGQDRINFALISYSTPVFEW